MSRFYRSIRGSGGGGGGGGGKGSGGGGGATRAAVEAPDSLRSRSFARVVDLICEGEIQGLVDGINSIYLDRTALAVGGEYNFSGVTVQYRNGTQAQTYMAGFDKVSSELPVSVLVPFATPVVRSISNVNVDAVRVTIEIPALYSQNTTTGDTNPYSVDIRIAVQNNGGGYVTKVEETISGKTTSRYQRSYKIDLPGPGPWDVRVTRVSPDDVSGDKKSQVFWSSYAEILDVKLRYPNSAIAGLYIDSTQFSRIPERAYDVKLLRVRIPVNYDPLTRVYTGIWDGTFKVDWTDCPAWHFYDLVTNDRYGLGKYVTAAMTDKWTLYTIAQYCDELVPDGFGGMEPRFTCNVYFQERADAYKVLMDMVSVFRGMLFWSAGSVSVSQDSPTDPVEIFSAANVVDGMFNYSGTARKKRHTVANVSWNDPADFYRQKVEYVEDQDGIARYGVIDTAVVAVGCTSRGQAHRVGRWLLYTERLETESVTFQTGLAGSKLRPGNIIKINDASRAGARYAGRVISATQVDANYVDVVVDGDVTPLSAATMFVQNNLGQIVEAIVVAYSGAGSRTIKLALMGHTIEPQAMWALRSGVVESQTFRVMAVAEKDRMKYEVSAIEHNAGKFDSIEQNLTLEQPLISTLKVRPDVPTGLIVTETIVVVGNNTLARTSVACNQSAGAATYQFRYRLGAGDWVYLSSDNSTQAYVDNLPVGSYEFQVAAINAVGTVSGFAQVPKVIRGKTAVPSDPTGLTIVPGLNMATATWDAAPDLDVQVAGNVDIRWTPKTSSFSWEDGHMLPDGFVDGNRVSADVDLLSGTYMIKFVDDGGRYSSGFASYTTTLADPITRNTIVTLDQHPTFAGTKTDVFVGDQSGLKFLALGSAYLISEMPGNISTWPFISAIGGAKSSGYYDFDSKIDLGAVYVSRVVGKLKIQTYDNADIISRRSGPVSSWSSISGGDINDSGVELQVSTTNDDPASGGAVWSAWAPLMVGDFSCRGYKFRIFFFSSVANHNVRVFEAGVVVDMPDRVEGTNGLSIPAVGYTYSYVAPFKTLPTVGYALKNGASGDVVAVTAESVSGFTIRVTNAGVGVVRTMDLMAKGFGRLIT